MRVSINARQNSHDVEFYLLAAKLCNKLELSAMFVLSKWLERLPNDAFSE